MIQCLIVADRLEDKYVFKGIYSENTNAIDCLDLCRRYEEACVKVMREGAKEGKQRELLIAYHDHEGSHNFYDETGSKELFEKYLII